MIDHVSIGVRDVARTKRFYDAALKPLGYTCLSETSFARLRQGSGRALDQRGQASCSAGLEIGFAFLFRRADDAQREVLPRGGVTEWRTRQR